MAQKPILAYILKSALDEYAGYTVQEIAEKFIVGTPEVQRIAVHLDHPDKTEVHKMPDRPDHPDGAGGSGMMSGELTEIFVNIEIQNNDTPGYPIPKRGIYYAARMISSQRGTIFK